jgi:hypothetical protein
MNPSAAPLAIDPLRFHPRRFSPLRHALVDHPLLHGDAVAELALRRRAAPLTGPLSVRPLSLFDVHSDPGYRQLVTQVLDALQPAIEPLDPGMHYRAGWILLAPPRSIVPVHVDPQHNLMLQVSGRNRLYVWDRRGLAQPPLDAPSRRRRQPIVWDEALRASAQVLDLLPGDGVFLPAGVPHMVESGSEPALTANFSFRTHESVRTSELIRLHRRFGEIGIALPEPDRAPRLDRWLYRGARLARHARARLKTALGQRAQPDWLAFAPTGH